MSKSKIRLTILFSLFLLIGCNSSKNETIESSKVATQCQKNSNGRKTNTGEEIKNNKTYITYKYENSTLSLMHYNTSFNCNENAIISTKSEVQENKIIITELEDLSAGRDRCVCLRDLKIEIKNILPDVYEINFNDNFIDDEILFMINLKDKTVGSVSYDRLTHPYQN